MSMHFSAGEIVTIGTIIFGAGGLYTQVRSLKGIVCNGLTDKVNNIDKSLTAHIAAAEDRNSRIQRVEDAVFKRED